MSHNTGYEVPSNDILDFSDNCENLDVLMNADQEYWTDRLGNKRPTIDYALRMAGFTPAGFDFTTGGVLKNGDRNKCVFNQADQTWYSWSGDLPYNVIAGSVPGEGWKVVNRNALTIARETLRRTYQEVGLNLVEGSFEQGGILVSPKDVILYERNGVAYGWTGEFTVPMVVDSNSSPIDSPNWTAMNVSSLNAITDKIRNNLVEGIVYPTPSVFDLKVGDNIPTGVTHLNFSNTILSSWDAAFSTQTHILQTLPVSNEFGGFNVQTNKGVFEFISDKIRKLRLDNDIKGFGIDPTGVRISDLQLNKLAQNSSVLKVLPGQKVRVSAIPTSFKIFTGGGRLIWDNNAGSLVTYRMPDNFKIENFEIETIYRNRLAINAKNLILNSVIEYQSDARTDMARYNAVEWQSDTSITVSNHLTQNTGGRFVSTGLDCVLTIDGIVTRVNHVGEGPDGNLHGTDGIKVSGGTEFSMRAININNHTCFGTSRDIIDTFIGGGECNITNVWADGFYFNQIEIKSQGTLDTNVDNTPHDINISNVVCRPGGLGTADTYAALIVHNQNEGSDSTSPRRINVSNYNSRRIGLNTTGLYHGIRVTGVFDLNLSNVNLLQAKNYGLSAIRCRNIKAVNSNIHGRERAGNVVDCNKISMVAVALGIDEQSLEESTLGLSISGVNNELVLEASRLIGVSRSLSCENATLNTAKFVSSQFTGPARVDIFTDIEFIGTDINARGTPAGGTDCFLSGTATPSAGLKFIGGKLSNARRGINEQSLTFYRAIGVAFENLTSPVGGGSVDSKRIILGCTANGAGVFPTPSGSDQIANNIVV